MSDTLIQIGSSHDLACEQAESSRVVAYSPSNPGVLPPGSSSGRQVEFAYSVPGGALPQYLRVLGEHGTATFMILGDVCTRRCGFCAVTSGRLQAGVDPLEPQHVAEAVAVMKLRHAVITSVDRDDLRDGGAHHFAQVIRAIHEQNPETAVEVLTPDFRGVPEALDLVLGARPEVFSHNMETVPRLYRQARPGSRYDRSLALLAEAARRRDAGEYGGRVKTGIMVGIGEAPDEVYSTIADIRGAGSRS